MRPGDRTDQHDDDRQGGGRGRAVGEQLHTDVRRQVRGHDFGPDHDCDQQARAERLGESTPEKAGSLARAHAGVAARADAGLSSADIRARTLGLIQ
ncbi:hypothetical protein GCM10023193_53040 [Planotetraspora kaengkrachanensis]|uniref:Uncharacterized protein n=1 Tax=Planotetraspora kaengkrachanensis TaxID=575193 RepID=A0A8J3PU28_9ACTN|nr:hypothetical protein Pka01_41880 [Planotetraspora kaengkrachanensis]